MIERIYTAEQLAGLPESGAEAQKIRAMFMAYGGGYDFCRFFRQTNATRRVSGFLAALDGSFVISVDSGADYEEIAQFLSMHGFTDLFCSFEAGNQLKYLLSAKFSKVNLMEYAGDKNHAELPPKKSPSEVWEIIGSRFAVPFEPWYLDMSHRVRHGVSRCFSDGKAALVMQHNINGESLLSQVCVLKEFEHQGYAGRLLKEVCAAVPGRVQIICEDSLVEFYSKCGFVLAGEKFVGVCK